MFARLIRPLMVLGVLAAVATATPTLADPPARAGTTATAPAASVDGFRSAKFGMDEAAVKKAILADFAIREDKIQREQNPVQRTSALIVTVDNLLPEAGPATVSYIFGFRSSTLIQMNVVWLKGKSEALYNAALTLRDYFFAMQFPPEAAVAGRLPDGRELVFRGTDHNGRRVEILYTPPSKDKESAQRAPSSLVLSYIQNPEKPDIFILEPGKF